ncbi:cytochrome P450 [Rhodococcus opacus]|uniref:Cytochrome P450 n=1 Tax=Rhodococcus opacus TaxID=37919 RepID=A0AAX3Y9B1_RHOOP|nr:cytochrome P450 [Rhodococcus opacus]MCZ4586285.1 cytochrome P450 [Rhodococcus opacus]UZG52971.1 cytochrome P450 [Rhodococcus opacus]WLF44746.1 cytochrome P450 [Rhodococcus opacus]
MTSTYGQRPAAPPEFNPLSESALLDPASMYDQIRTERPVFWHEQLGTWVVTRRDDVDTVLMDWKTFSCRGNGGNLPVPEQFTSIVTSELMAHISISMDPPIHTEMRRVAQRGFLKPVIDALEPEIEARAHRIIDRLADRGTAELMEDYCLELTTQTLMALMDLPDSFEPMMRQLRDDHFAVLASGREPMEEPRRTEVWTRYTNAQLALREVVRERRDSTASDLISVMASARNRDGEPTLSDERVALHLCEFSAAGTDTTAQGMANAVIFLSRNEDQLDQAQADPSLWPRVFEETLRRRPSAPFASRQATRDVELSGVTIPAGDMVWVALASASNDPQHYPEPKKWNIHRDEPTDHYAFTKGRHTCLGQPLGRTQGTAGVRVLFERLPSLRIAPDFAQDFLPLVMLPIRRSLVATWDPADSTTK